MANLAIIPARGGSKRIPRKNIKIFLGEPIISYSIRFAIESQLFDEIMVSTDDNEIAEVAMIYGAKVPFKRSQEKSNDFSVLSQVVEEVIDGYSALGKDFDYICCILPTAVLITPSVIKMGLDQLLNFKYDSVFPVLPYSSPIQRALKIENDKISMIWPDQMNARSQDLIPSYHDAGQFYWLDTKSFKQEKRLFMKNSGALVISQMQAQDIDTETDWKLAEIKYSLRDHVEKDNS